MKYRNYNSAIHNFAHSFISVDYTKSPKLAVNVLIDLNKKGMTPLARFDFLNNSIEPAEAISKESKQLLKDYLSWLPEHFDNHKCDLDGLEKLEITLWTDFSKAFSPPGMNNAKEITVSSKTVWKAKDREEKSVDISQTEVIKEAFLRNRIPE